MDKITGTIQWWSQKHLGIIVVKNSDNSVDRYFLPYSKIIAGPAVPKIGDIVRFNPSNIPPPEGKLRLAVSVEILEGDKAIPEADAIKKGVRAGGL